MFFDLIFFDAVIGNPIFCRTISAERKHDTDMMAFFGKNFGEFGDRSSDVICRVNIADAHSGGDLLYVVFKYTVKEYAVKEGFML